MVIHVFTANRYQLVPSISLGLVTVYKEDASHVLLLYGNKDLNKQKYKELFEKVGFNDFLFCTTLRQFISVIRKYNNASVLFHAGSYHWFLIAWLLGCKSLNWVCWGSGASTGCGVKSRFSSLYKRFIYNRFDSIITLMDADKDSIIHDFHVDPSKIETISYASSGSAKNKYDYLKEKLLLQETSNPKPVVLLGNNPSCINGYLEIIPRLKQFAGRIVVKCMLNYSLEKNDKYNELIRLGRTLFGKDFISSEEFYEDKGDYIKYMNECDIFICPVYRQSGLGAIYTCLGLGKKIYLAGKNLQWIRSAFDAKVYDLNDICESMSFTDFSRNLSIEEKKKNYNSVINRRLLQEQKWHKYLAGLDQK